MSCRILLALEQSTLLSASDGRRRGPLDAAAEEMLRELTALGGEFRGYARDHAVEAVSLFNQAALIQYQYGDFDRAADLCNEAVSLCELMYSSTRATQWISLMVQPYINRARLAVATGDASAVVSALERLYSLVFDQEDLVFDGHLIAHDALDPKDEQLKIVTMTVYVTDSIKAYMAARDYYGLLRFVAQAEQLLGQSLVPDLKRRCIEAHALGSLCMGDPNGAQRVLREWMSLPSFDPRRDVWLFCMAARIYVECARADDATTTINKILRYAAALLQREIVSMPVFHAVYTAGLLALCVQNDHLAEECGNVALATCEAANDEVGVLKSLCLLSRSVTGAGERKTVRERLRAESVHSYYRVMRAVGCYELGENGDAVTDPCTRNDGDYWRMVAGMLTELPEQIPVCSLLRKRLTGMGYTSVAQRHEGRLSEWRHPSIERLYYTVLGLKSFAERAA